MPEHLTQSLPDVQNGSRPRLFSLRRFGERLMRPSYDQQRHELKTALGRSKVHEDFREGWLRSINNFPNTAPLPDIRMLCEIEVFPGTEFLDGEISRYNNFAVIEVDAAGFIELAVKPEVRTIGGIHIESEM